MRTQINHLRIAFKSAVRNFQKNWVYQTLNILGLAIAFATILLAASYLYQETSYESFHQNADRIFRPTYQVNTQNNFSVHFARIPVDYINELPYEIPEIEKLIRFQNQEQKYVRIGDKRFKPKHAYVTDQDVFEVFSLPFLAGEISNALSSPNSVVVTASTAKRYFGSEDIVGKEMVITGDWSEDEEIYMVTGVMQDLPTNTHLPIDMLFSFSNVEDRRGWAYVYTLLSKGAQIESVNSKAHEFIKKYTDDQSLINVSYEFQALPEIHLTSHLAREIVPNSQILYVRIFFGVALFVWLIALINFSNLSSALAMSRGKEIGVRRVLGATNRNLFFFSLSEAIVYSIAAFLMGSIFAFILFPQFSELTGISTMPSKIFIFTFSVGLILLSGVLAGIFPALVLMSIKVLTIIKRGNNWSMRKNSIGNNVKRIMIAIQFCATIILIGSALFAYQQFRFINNKNLGLEAEQVLAINQIPHSVTKQYNIFKNQLKEIPGISEVSACMQMPSSEIRDVGPVLVRGVNEDPDQAPMMDLQIVDQDFIQMMNLQLLAGEDFTQKAEMNPFPILNEEYTAQEYLSSAPRKYLINETAMKQLGYQDPMDIIGQEINWSIGSYKLAYGPVTGVLKDYHQESLKNQVDPVVMVVEPLWLQNFLIKVETKNLEQTIAQVEKVWNDLFPFAMEYAFLDELYNKLYHQDRVQLKLLSGFTLIAIFIAFMGLVSLVAFALKSRSKELAIRRVIGANLASLTALIGKEYFWIVTFSAVVGIPLSYMWVTQWLQDFAYHIQISPLIYAFSVLIIYTLLIVTIYLQTLKATIDNPVEALREE